MLRLLTRLNIGGPSRHALILTRGLADRYPTVLAAGQPSPEEGKLSDPAVPVVDVPLVRPLRPVTDLRAIRAVRRLLRRERPAILHTHMAKAGTVGRVAALTMRRRPVLVHTFHGHVLDGYFRPATARTFLGIERVLARRTDALVAVSDEIRDELLALGIGRDDQWRTIPLGLDLDELLGRAGRSGVLRARVGIGDEPLVGMLGRLVPIKDVATAIRAMARVPDAHLALVGDGEDRAALVALATDLGLADRVHFVGWRHDIGDVLADIDVALLTSRNEGTPVALIEAAAAGRPAVATDVGGVRAVIDDGVSGLVVPVGDDQAVAVAVRRRLVDDVAALYDELLGARTNRYRV